MQFGEIAFTIYIFCASLWVVSKHPFSTLIFLYSCLGGLKLYANGKYNFI